MTASWTMLASVRCFHSPSCCCYSHGNCDRVVDQRSFLRCWVGCYCRYYFLRSKVCGPTMAVRIPSNWCKKVRPRYRFGSWRRNVMRSGSRCCNGCGFPLRVAGQRVLLRYWRLRSGESRNLGWRSESPHSNPSCLLVLVGEMERFVSTWMPGNHSRCWAPVP